MKFTNGVREIDFEGKSWRDELLGASFDNRIQQKIIETRIAESIKNKTRLPELSMVAALSPRTKTIKEIGFNVEGDLFTNNFGEWLAGIFTPYLTAWSKTLKNLSNASVSLAFCGTAWYNWNTLVNQNVGTQMQLGSGTTTPTRADYKIETAFTTSPESAAFETSYGQYTENGTGACAGAISAGGSGTVNEDVLIGKWQGSYFCLIHDAISPGVSFSAGDVLCSTIAWTF